MHLIYFHVWTYLYLYVVPNFPSIQTLISGLWTTVVAQLHLFNFQLQFLFVDPFSPCGIFGPDAVALDYAVWTGTLLCQRNPKHASIIAKCMKVCSF